MHNAAGDVEDVLKVTQPATTTDVSEVAKRAMKVLTEVINSVCTIHYADIRNLKEIPESDIGKELVECVYLMLQNSSYKLRCQSELTNADHDVFESNDIDNLCIMGTEMTKSGGYGYVFCSTLQFSARCRELEGLTEPKEAVNNGERAEVEVQEEKYMRYNGSGCSILGLLDITKRMRGTRG